MNDKKLQEINDRLDSMDGNLEGFVSVLDNHIHTMADQIGKLKESTETKIAALKEMMDAKLTLLKEVQDARDKANNLRFNIMLGLLLLFLSGISIPLFILAIQKLLGG